jgi:hypothetical protein
MTIGHTSHAARAEYEDAVQAAVTDLVEDQLHLQPVQRAAQQIRDQANLVARDGQYAMACGLLTAQMTLEKALYQVREEGAARLIATERLQRAEDSARTVP